MHLTVDGTVLVTVFLPFSPNSTVSGNGAKTLGLAVPGLWGVNNILHYGNATE